MSAAPEVDRSVLGALRRVGDGGQGIVYLTDKVRINRTWEAAYKEYLADTTFDPDVLRRMVAFVPELDEGSGRWLCDTTAWPAALVLSGGRVTGFLMRRVPDRFRMPWGDGGADVPAALQYLLNPQAYLNRKNIGLDDRTRLRLLEAIADVMARLHSLGVVIGDLSPNNLLVDLADPACFLIDCDGMRLRDRDVVHQVETPEWQVPRPGYEPIATKASDSYKFGLLAARLFAQDQMGQDVSVLAGVSPELGVLARRSLDADSTTRPSLGDWRGALGRALAAPAPPTPPPRPRRTQARGSTASSRTVASPRRGTPRPGAATAQASPPAAAARAPQRKPEEEHPVFYVVLGVAMIVFVLGCVVGSIVFVANLF
ncbi:lipopolysaccharide kinase (Kdo/WaaP) family protein [Pseudosporangium ferrugineum]|uniref:Lipopolysaccharide kinase (Kdo/WaaP) family protein n=1 Tax=Pseudosporangium ferrugineum TaxID=439699 RepID=A0A2T0RF14_9ACTN|nr:lipopolysaccharide kinase (Kdo/WaaP) family protein [Pseudosporangium ferrugineum]